MCYDRTRDEKYAEYKVIMEKVSNELDVRSVIQYHQRLMLLGKIYLQPYQQKLLAQYAKRGSEKTEDQKSLLAFDQTKHE